MSSNTIIVIGAGAAGLAVAKELRERGANVLVLEARNRIGGRICTETIPGFSTTLELGAEFVHGDLPETLRLLKEAGIPLLKAGGEMWRLGNSELAGQPVTDYWELFEEKVKDITEDITINQFLDTYFSDEQYAGLRASVRGYAAGYDSADPDKASTIALRDEWLNEDESEQHRIEGGYGRLMNYLADCITRSGGSIHLKSPVTKIEWQAGKVNVITGDGTVYDGDKVIVTLPVNVLAVADGRQGAITFSPALPQVKSAVNKMGMGAIVKILFEFRRPFWMDNDIAARTGKNLDHLGFVLSSEVVPTWWTLHPQQAPLLTGWLGGPAALQYEHTSDEEMAALGLASLARIFKSPEEHIRSLLVGWKAANWTADPYSRGSYSYATVDTVNAREILNAPIKETIYFAGEALYAGKEMGTVEAALASGEAVAKKILPRLLK